MRARRAMWVALVATLATTATSGLLSPVPADASHVAPRFPLIVGPRETLDTYTSTTESWNPPFPVPVADRSGVVTVAWHHDDKLLAARRNPAGHWGPTSTLVSCNKPYCVSSDYALGADGAGTVTLLWTQVNGGRSKVYVASLPRGGSWSVPVSLGPSRGSGWGPTLSVSRSGAALVTYDTRRRASGAAVTAIYRPAGKPWSAARRRVFDDAQQAATGLSDSGTGVLVVRRTGRADNRMRAYRLRRGARWSRPTKLGVSIHYDLPPYAMAVGPRGNAVAAWLRNDRIKARVMNRHGSWGAVHTLSSRGTVEWGTLQVSMQAGASVLWSTHRAAIRWATKPGGRRWSVRTAYPRRTGFLSAMNVNRRGDLGIIWQRWPAPRAQLYTGVHTAAGWSASARVPVTFFDPSPWGSVAVLPDGSEMVFSFSEAGAGGPSSVFSTLGFEVTPAR